MEDLFLFGTYTYNIMILYLLRSYTHGGLILIPISRRTHTYACIRRILIQDSQRTYIYIYIYISDFCQTDTYPYTRPYLSLKSPVGVHITYAYTEVPLGTTKLILILRNLHLFRGIRRYYRDMTERVRVLRNLFLYGSTRKYYKTYTGTSYLNLVL